MREYNGKKLKLRKGTVLLIEGIHALNARLIPQVPASSQFKIFINTLTAASLDNHNAIPTSDNRLLRRIIRDYNKGAFSPRETISQWPKVCEAEEKWISPYQEDADVMFNSAYLLEFAVLRNHAVPILSGIPKNCPEYAEAHRLLNQLLRAGVGQGNTADVTPERVPRRLILQILGVFQKIPGVLPQSHVHVPRCVV